MTRKILELPIAVCAAALLVAVHHSCLKNELTPLPFFEVLTRPPTGRLEEVMLKGEITGIPEGTRPDAFGFIYSRDIEAIQRTEPSGTVIMAATLAAGGHFEARFEGFNPSETYYFRAFASIGERRIYGSVQSYRLGEIALMGAVTVKNDSALMGGVLTGLKITGDTVLEYGHVYSATNATPALGQPDCTVVPQSGQVSADLFFEGKTGNLNFNTTYTVRAYARGKRKIFYSAPATFPVRDGWKKIAGLPSFQGAYGIGHQGTGYFGFGCDAVEACLQTSLPNDLWRFTPDNQAGTWSKAAAVDPLFMRTNVSSFAIGDTVYFVMGEYFDGVVCTNQPCFVFNFMKLNTKTQQWEYADLPDPVPSFRSYAASFTLNGKGYVGTGEGSDGTHLLPLNDFWQYNPANGAWRKVAVMPLREKPSDPIRYDEGRAGAAAFVSGGFAYVGAGRTSAFPLNDFWRFTPPATDAASDTGHWQQISYFRGVGRSGGVAFQIDGKGYFGLGYNLSYGRLQDFWQYNPLSDEWVPRTPFPPEGRDRAVGFSIGPYGYAGTGVSKIVSTGLELETNLQAHGDMWRYEPERK